MNKFLLGLRATEHHSLFNKRSSRTIFFLIYTLLMCIRIHLRSLIVNKGVYLPPGWGQVYFLCLVFLLKENMDDRTKQEPDPESTAHTLGHCIDVCRQLVKAQGQCLGAVLGGSAWVRSIFFASCFFGLVSES